tara:strand:+ start:875 stop:2179 length:1305 start_codon:yes stop_codon:yes gene_type:complete
MAHNYSKGAQVIGDLKAADDAERNTLIDFGEDRIDLQTSGSTRFKISGSNGEITFNEAYTFPISDGSSEQVIKTNGNGILSWADQSGGLTTVQTLNTIANATGDVVHNCTNSNVFYHSSIAANFTPNFTQLGMENNQTTDVALILSQGGTGYLPEAFKVNSTSSTLFWEGTSMPTASANKTDTVNLRVIRMSDTYSTFAKFSNTIQITVSSGVTIPSNALLFLDASDANSYAGSGTNWVDLSGQGNNATMFGTPTYNSTDKLFDMDGGDYMTVPSGFADFSNGATFFFVADFGTGQNWERLLDFSVGGATNHAFNVGRHQTSTGLSLQYYTVAENNSNQNINSAQISNNTLVSYCITTDGTNAKVYKNGSLAQTISFPYTPSNTTRTQNYIARSRAGTNEDLRGKLAVAGIFNRDLSASEITALHNAYATIYSL